MDTKTEERIKAYLDRVGYILIQDDPDGGIVTDYRDMRDSVVFVPISGNTQLENLFYAHSEDDADMKRYIPRRESSSDMTKAEKRVYNSLMKPRRIPKEITRLQEKRKRIDALHAAHPEAYITFVPVDTENRFRYDGKEWRINDIPQYRPKNIRGDVWYDMDHVVCAKCKDGIHWFDQEFREISGHVHEADIIQELTLNRKLPGGCKHPERFSSAARAETDRQRGIYDSNQVKGFVTMAELAYAADSKSAIALGSNPNRHIRKEVISHGQAGGSCDPG